MLLYTEGWQKNLREQVTEPANACFQMREEENLIIPMIKAIIRRKKGKKTLTQKRLSWKASQLNLPQPIKRVIKHSRSAYRHSCMTKFAHLQNQFRAKMWASSRKIILTHTVITLLLTDLQTHTFLHQFKGLLKNSPHKGKIATSVWEYYKVNNILEPWSLVWYTSSTVCSSDKGTCQRPGEEGWNKMFLFKCLTPV